jgi:hypothetical protein
MKNMIMAALLLGAGMGVSTAKAEINYGPIHDNKGMCFNRAAGSAELGYGYWAACPKPAAAPATHHHSAKHN